MNLTQAELSKLNYMSTTYNEPLEKQSFSKTTLSKKSIVKKSYS